MDPVWTRHVRDWDLDQLFAAGESLESLTQHPGWHVLLDVLGAEITTIDRDLDSGGVPKSRAEYAAAHGRRGGLRAAEVAATAIITRYRDRLAEQQAKHEGSRESDLVRS